MALVLSKALSLLSLCLLLLPQPGSGTVGVAARLLNDSKARLLWRGSSLAIRTPGGQGRAPRSPRCHRSTLCVCMCVCMCYKRTPRWSKANMTHTSALTHTHTQRDPPRPRTQCTRRPAATASRALVCARNTTAACSGDCPTGRYSLRAVTCTACPAGTYGETTTLPAIAGGCTSPCPAASGRYGPYGGLPGLSPAARDTRVSQGPLSPRPWRVPSASTALGVQLCVRVARKITDLPKL